MLQNVNQPKKSNYYILGIFYDKDEKNALEFLFQVENFIEIKCNFKFFVQLFKFFSNFK